MTDDKDAQKYHALTEQRIDHIMQRMQRMQWIRGETGKLLAKEWDLSLSRVEHLSAEASKRIRQYFADPKDIATEIQLALDKIFRDALEAGERKVAIDALRLWADISGIKASARYEVITSEATPAKASELVRQLFGAVTPHDHELDKPPCDGDAEECSPTQ